MVGKNILKTKPQKTLENGSRRVSAYNCFPETFCTTEDTPSRTGYVAVKQ